MPNFPAQAFSPWVSRESRAGPATAAILGRNGDQFILFAAMQDVMISRSWPSRQPVLVDAGGNLRLLHDVCQIGRKSVTDVDHRVGALQKRRAEFMPRFRIKMPPDGWIFQIGRSQAVEYKG